MQTKEQLTALSDDHLLQSLQTLVRREKETAEKIIRHLVEVDERRLFLSLGHGSLYAYLTDGLGYCNASAGRRIDAVRAVKKMPEILTYLERGELTLSTAAVISSSLGKGRDEELLSRVRGRTFEEAREVVAFFNPVASSAVRDSVKTVAVGAIRDEKQGALVFQIGGTETKTAANAGASPTAGEPTLEKRHIVKFSAGDEFMSLFERAKELSFHGEKEDLAFEKILGKALQAYIEKRCPKEREKRRLVRRVRASTKGKENAGRGKPALTAPQSTNNKEPIPQNLRDAVLCRDNHCCSFVGSNGKRCKRRYDLEVDHVVPRSFGGKTELDNLRTLCRAHNVFAAEQFFGSRYVEMQIERARGRRS